LPRRFAPRNDKGRVVCHVALLLAMTRTGVIASHSLRHCKPLPPSLQAAPTVIASRPHCHCEPSPLSLRAIPTVIASRRRSNPSFVLHHMKYGLPRRFAPRNDGVGVDCHVVSLLAMTRGGWFATSLCSSQ